jgi:ferritin-like protein
MISLRFPAQGGNVEKKQHYLMQFFGYEHLPERLREISKPFCDLAQRMHRDLPDNPESTTALRKLLEAKDCAVRAELFKNE